MSGKRYKVSTICREFECDKFYSGDLKKEKGVFFIKGASINSWEKIINIKERHGFFEFILSPVFKFFDTLERSIIGVLFLMLIWAFLYFPVFLLMLIDLALPKLYVNLSETSIDRLLGQNNKHSFSFNNSSSRISESGVSGGSGIRGNYGSGSSGAGGSGSSTYVSHEQLDGALKAIESKGISFDDMVNKKNNHEREELFAVHFGDNELGAAASERFNKQVVWPARKSTLKKLIEDGDYENESDKQQLSEKLNAWGEEMTNDNFQKFAREIKNFTEKKQRKENHIKYEGRLSNKAIQSIKEYHGYICMGCGLDPVAEYGESMKGILEAHHKKPWAEIENEQTREVNANDFFVLCPNCHKMIHKLDQPDSLDELKEILNPPRKISWWD